MSTDTLENDATPFTAVTGPPPESVPPPALFAIASVTAPAKPVATLPFASRAVTWTVGDIATPATVEDGCCVNARVAALPGLTTTVAVCVTATPAIVAETVFDSATVDESVPVAAPLALVVPTGWVRVLPDPLAASTTVAPWIGLWNSSRAVTVMVEAAPPAVIGDVATTVDWLADTPLVEMLNDADVAFESPVLAAASV